MLTKGNIIGLIESFSNDNGSSATVPIATSSVAGIVKIGSGIIVSADGTITVSTSGVQGTWNASTNTPSIPTASASNKGWYYIVSVAGTTAIDGINSWAIGDWILSDGTKWTKIPNTTIIATTSSAGEIIVGKGLNVDGTGLTTVKIGTGLKFDASNNILADPANIDVTQLKNFSALVTGKPKGFFTNTATLSTFANCSKGDFYIYNGTSSFTLGGDTFNTGDQLWCTTTFTGTPTDLTTNFTYVANTVLQATTSSLGTVKLGSGTPLMDSSTPTVGTSLAMAREDHVHPSDTNKISKISTSTNNAIVTWSGTTGNTLADSTKLLPAGAIVGTTDVQSLTNKTLLDSTTSIANATDNTKIVKFDTSGNTTAISGTLKTNFSSSKTLNFPDKAGTLQIAPNVVTLSTAGNISLSENTVYEINNLGVSGSVYTLPTTASVTGTCIQFLVACSGFDDSHTFLVSGNINGATNTVINNRSFVEFKFYYSASASTWILANSNTGY